jgi:HemY protein
LLLQESLSNHANTESASSAALQKQFKKSLPFLYENPELLLAYARSLMQLDDFVAARSAIEKALASQWNEQLILRYGEWELGSPHKQLQFAEKHRANRSDDAALALTLARLSLRCELWGKAREYYDQALLLSPNAAGYAEYSKLLQGLGEEKLAQAATERAYAQAGLSDLSLALPKVNQPEP